MLKDKVAAARVAAGQKHEACATCRFYRATPKGSHGDCHRYPPNGSYNDRSQVHPTNWCGEYVEDTIRIIEEAHEDALKENVARNQAA